MPNISAVGAVCVALLTQITNAQPANVVATCQGITIRCPARAAYVYDMTATVTGGAEVDFIGEVFQPEGPGTDVYQFYQGSGIVIWGPCEVSLRIHDPVTGDVTEEFAWGGPADFNCDGIAGGDEDIAALFTCLADGCASEDFNGDGDVGTDADLEAFFRVLAGGAC